MNILSEFIKTPESLLRIYVLGFSRWIMARALINLLGSGHFQVLNWTKVKSEGPSGGSLLL